MCQKNVGLELSDSPGRPLSPRKVRAEMVSSLASPHPLKNTGPLCPRDLPQVPCQVHEGNLSYLLRRYLHVCKKEPVKKTEIGGSPPVG